MIDDALMVLESDPSVSKDTIEQASEEEGDLLNPPTSTEPIEKAHGEQVGGVGLVIRHI